MSDGEIRSEILKLDAAMRREVGKVRRKYKEKKEMLYSQCEHDFPEWLPIINPHYRRTSFGDLRVSTTCKKCGYYKSKIITNKDGE